MLHEREFSVAVECQGESFAVAGGGLAATRVAVEPDQSPALDVGGRYGEGRRLSLPGLVTAIGAHLLLLPVLLGLGQHVMARKEVRLVSMNLSPPAPPPPAQRPTPPESKQLATTIQPPVLKVSIPQQPIVLALSDPAPLPTAVPQPAATIAPPAPLGPPAPPSVVSASDLGTRMVSGGPPRYPLESRRKKEQGTVELLIVLGIDGAVETISVGRSSGFARLDNAALNAVRRWRWSPTTRDGAPVKVRGVVEIPFVLQAAG